MRGHCQGAEISPVEFAKALGLSELRLRDIEDDRIVVNIKLAKKIAKKMQLPAEWLVKLAIQDQIRKEGLSLRVSQI